MADSAEEIEWDIEQLKAILAEPDARLLVEAAPGAGKTEVACRRVAYLIEQGMAGSRILLVSFTNVAVQEMRNRIDQLLGDSEDSVAGLRIRTIDSLAGLLRHAYEEEPEFKDYTENLRQFVRLLESGDPYLEDFIQSQYRHLVVDEAQDVTGIRRVAMRKLFDRLHPGCGVTVFGDRAQAIYGWTDDDRAEASEDGTGDLVREIRSDADLGFRRLELENQYRTTDEELVGLFGSLRAVITQRDHEGRNQFLSVRTTLRERSDERHPIDLKDDLPGLVERLDRDALVLFRTRSALALASSFLSTAGVSHRLRHSGITTGLEPWIAALFSDCREPRMNRIAFSEAWQDLAEPLKGGAEPDEMWDVLFGVAGGRRGTIRVDRLQNRLANRRPPAPLLQREMGHSGPLLSTIHAAKGREARDVVLLLPEGSRAGDRMDTERWEEEARVLYVGATRPRETLAARTTPDPPSSLFDDRRVVRTLDEERVQLLVGLSGDVDPDFSAARQLTEFGTDARTVQHHLLATVDEAISVTAELERIGDTNRRIIRDEAGVIGALSAQIYTDLWNVGTAAFGDGSRPARRIKHLWKIGARTVVRTDQEAGMSNAAIPFRDTGFWAVPVIKGLPTVHYRTDGRRS